MLHWRICLISVFANVTLNDLIESLIPVFSSVTLEDFYDTCVCYIGGFV